MKDGPNIASIAALLGDPGRANMLTALMDGRALTVSELAQAAGVALPTASGHIHKLEAAGLLVPEKQGRHRYMRLSGHDVAEVLEALMGLAQRTGSVRVRTGPKDAALRVARVCYDHLAGEHGVRMLDALAAKEFLVGGDRPRPSPAGKAFFEAFGIDIDLLTSARRPLCRTCLDWSERRSHLGGGLGSALLGAILVKGWARRQSGRVIAFSPQGAKSFAQAFA